MFGPDSAEALTGITRPGGAEAPDRFFPVSLHRSLYSGRKRSEQPVGVRSTPSTPDARSC